MGTRADFYVGRGKDAEWLGSISCDGYPEGIDIDVLMTTTRETYEAALMRFFAQRDDVSGPDHGWPWPWNDSNITDYAYAFDEGKVWAHGYGWFDPMQPEPEEHDDFGKPTTEFPDMSERKNVAVPGSIRSGMIAFGVTE
jgi:hypothetical protein